MNSFPWIGPHKGDLTLGGGPCLQYGSSHRRDHLAIFVQGNDEKGTQPLLSQQSCGTIHGDMSQKMICQQLGISRTRLETQPGCGHQTALHQVAKRVIKMAMKKRHQSTCKLARRITKAE